MDKESLCEEFPRTWQEFIEYYAEDPPNGGDKRVPVYRVMQMMCYYVDNNYLKIGDEYSSADFTIEVTSDATCARINGSPHFKIVRRDKK